MSSDKKRDVGSIGSGDPALSAFTQKLSTTTLPGDLIGTGANANALADSLGVSPLYRQKDSARWQNAAHVYHSSRAHSPAPAFAFPSEPNENMKSPISLEDIAIMNRRRHEESGGAQTNSGRDVHGPLELEAIAAVHELACSVQSICVSEILPRTADLIFVNVRTYEDLPFTLELTMKGWRIASTHSDSMNGDYMHVELHTRYFKNAKEVLDVISPGHSNHFEDCLTERLKQLQACTNDDEADTRLKQQHPPCAV